MNSVKSEAMPVTVDGKFKLPPLFQRLFRVFLPPGIRLSGAAVQFLSTVLIARFLGDEGSSTFFFWSAVLTSFAIVATFGLEHLVLRNVPRLKAAGEPDKLISYLSTIRGISLVLSLVIGIGLILYAYVKGGADGIQFHVWYFLLPLTLGAMAMCVVNGEALKGLSKPASGVFFGHFVPVSLFCFLIVINLTHLSSPLLLTIYAGAYVTAVAVVRFGPTHLVRGRIFSVPDWNTSRPTLAEGFPIFSSNALGALCYVIPLAVLEFSRSPEEISHLTTSFRVSILLSVLATAIHGVFAPQLSCAAEAKGDLKGVFKVYAKSTYFTFGILLVPAMIGILFPEWVMSVFGDDFREGAVTLRWLLISSLVSMFIGPVHQLLVMTGNTRFLAVSGVFKLLLTVAISMLLIPIYGGIGMAIAIMSSYLLEEVVGIVWVFVSLSRETKTIEKN